MKFLLVVVVLGVAVYLLVRVIQRRGISSLRGGRGRRPPTRPKTVRRPIAPDDDPDFLRDLDRDRKRRRHDDESET